MERMRQRQAWSFYEGILQSGEVAEKGKLVCIDLTAGTLVMGQADANLLPIGYAAASFTGDGVKKLRVELFTEIWVDLWTNDGSSAVAADDVGNVCYIKDAVTVSMDGTSRSVAGRVWGVSSAGVLVQMAIGIGIQGPAGADA